MNKLKNILRGAWSLPIVRHVVSGAVAVMISTQLVNRGVDESTAYNAGQAAGEIIKQMPVQ